MKLIARVGDLIVKDILSFGSTQPASLADLVSVDATGQGVQDDPLALLVHRLDGSLAKGDHHTVRGMLAGGFTHIDAAGCKREGAEAIQALVEEPRQANVQRVVRHYGLVAIVVSRSDDTSTGDRLVLQAWEFSSDRWMLLLQHANLVLPADAPHTHPPLLARSADAPAPRCANPCEFVPYEPASDAEREIIETFGALERAVTQNDAATWSHYFTEEFIAYRTAQHPTTKEDRMEQLRRGRSVNAETWVAEADDLRFWVRGDTAVMLADHRLPGDRRPPYRATRIWVRRDGRWQMTFGQQTRRSQ